MLGQVAGPSWEPQPCPGEGGSPPPPLHEAASGPAFSCFGKQAAPLGSLLPRALVMVQPRVLTFLSVEGIQTEIDCKPSQHKPVFLEHGVAASPQGGAPGVMLGLRPQGPARARQHSAAKGSPVPTAGASAVPWGLGAPVPGACGCRPGRALLATARLFPPLIFFPKPRRRPRGPPGRVERTSREACSGRARMSSPGPSSGGPPRLSMWGGPSTGRTELLAAVSPLGASGWRPT